MRRRRLLVLVAVAAALVAVGVAAAHLDQELARAAAQSTTDASSPINALDALAPATTSDHGVLGITQLRGLRSDWRGGTLRAGTAVLAAALVVLALRSRRAFRWSTAASSLGRGTVPLGRGPPTLLAM
jgi:uncharacterized membrane protein YgdD (TMEM256/DUF423 family)